MRKYFTLLFCLYSLMAYAQPEKKLADAFIQSVAKKNFKLLEPYIYNATIAKNIFGNEFGKIPPAKQAEAIKKNKLSLQSKWEKVVSTARTNKVDFSKVVVKQVIPGAIEGTKYLTSLLITYEYNGVEWDDLVFIINKQGDAKYIVELPNNTAMFALNEDRRGKNVKDFQIAKDRNDPNIKEHLKNAVIALKKLVSANDQQQLYNHMVYSGDEDKEGRWKRTVDPSKAEDVESAKRMMGKLKNSFAKCDEIQYGDIRTEKESEGVWYVINTTCGDKKHTYAFLKLNNVFVLGDVD